MFEITDGVDSEGYVYSSDTLFGLNAERVGDMLKIEFDSAIDSEFSWQTVCREAAVIEVLPRDPNGDV